MLFEFCSDKTLITITHKLDHLEAYHQIIVMELGSIVEIGEYSELKKNHDSFFNKLSNNTI